jgi:hypothetical protein
VSNQLADIARKVFLLTGLTYTNQERIEKINLPRKGRQPQIRFSKKWPTTRRRYWDTLLVTIYRWE